MVAITVLQAAARLTHGVVLDLIYTCDTALTVYLAAACYRLERDDGLFVALEERLHLPRYALTAILVFAVGFDIIWWLGKIAG